MLDFSIKNISSSFFKKNTLELAQDLLGKLLICEQDEQFCVGRIVETEAYLHNDAASHSAKGKTLRNWPMFGKAGSIYIYFIYGMYRCFNVVSAAEGQGEAVLIRALEPIRGLELMKQRRELFLKKQKTISDKELCRGPAKLVIAMGINPNLNGKMLNRKNGLYLAEDKKSLSFDSASSPRIGISKAQELHYRFYIKNNGYVSG